MELIEKYKDHFNPEYYKSGYHEMWINFRTNSADSISNDKKVDIKNSIYT